MYAGITSSFGTLLVQARTFAKMMGRRFGPGNIKLFHNPNSFVPSAATQAVSADQVRIDVEGTVGYGRPVAGLAHRDTRATDWNNVDAPPVIVFKQPAQPGIMHEERQFLEAAEPNVPFFDKAAVIIREGDASDLSVLLNNKSYAHDVVRLSLVPLLHLALRMRRTQCVHLLLDYGASVSEMSHIGRCHQRALHFAAASGDVHLVEMVMDAGADGEVNVIDSNGWTPLHVAVSRGHDTIVGRLLEYGCQPNATDYQNRSPLILSCLNGFSRITKRLLEAGANVHQYDSARRTPLICGAANGHGNVLQILIKWGSDVACADVNGRIALHHALAFEHNQCAAALLAAGSNVNTRDHAGLICGQEWLDKARYVLYMKDYDTLSEMLLAAPSVNLRPPNEGGLIHWAAALGDVKTVGILVRQYKADVSLRGEGDRTAMQMAAYEGHLNIVQMLEDYGADVNDTDIRGWTALHWAAAAGRANVVVFLLESAADPNIEDNRGRTPLNLAALGGRIDCMKDLIARGAILDHKASDGRTSLHLACLEGHGEAAKVLLEYGAQADATDHQDMTPVDCAMLTGHDEVSLEIGRFEWLARLNRENKHVRHDTLESISTDLADIQGIETTLKEIVPVASPQKQKISGNAGIILSEKEKEWDRKEKKFREDIRTLKSKTAEMEQQLQMMQYKEAQERERHEKIAEAKRMQDDADKKYRRNRQLKRDIIDKLNTDIHHIELEYESRIKKLDDDYNRQYSQLKVDYKKLKSEQGKPVRAEGDWAQLQEKQEQLEEMKAKRKRMDLDIRKERERIATMEAELTRKKEGASQTDWANFHAQRSAYHHRATDYEQSKSIEDIAMQSLTEQIKKLTSTRKNTITKEYFDEIEEKINSNGIERNTLDEDHREEVLRLERERQSKIDTRKGEYQKDLEELDKTLQVLENEKLRFEAEMHAVSEAALLAKRIRARKKVEMPGKSRNINVKGQAFVCGSNIYGQLGLGTYQDSIVPTLMTSTTGFGWNSCASASFAHTVVVAGGDAYSCGFNGVGTNRLGHYPEDTPSDSPPGFFKNLFTCGIAKRPHKKFHPEDYLDGVPHPRPIGIDRHFMKPRFVSVSSGLYHTVALTDQGRLWAWGGGQYGQLGHEMPSKIPMKLGVDAFRRYPLPLVNLADFEQKPKKRGVPQTKSKDEKKPNRHLLNVLFKQVDAGALHNVALTVDGQIYTWGSNAHGESGHDKRVCATPELLTTMQEHLIDQSAIHRIRLSLSRYSRFYIPAMEGAHPEENTKEINLNQVRDKEVIEEIRKHYENLMREQNKQRITQLEENYAAELEELRSVQAEPDDAINKEHRQQQQALVVDRLKRQLQDIEKRINKALNVPFELFIKTAVRLFIDHLKEKVLKDIEDAVIQRVMQVSAGYSWSAAVTDRGHLYTWGNGKLGRLGHGDQSDRTAPNLVNMHRDDMYFTQVSCGYSHGAALSEEGHIYTWGWNKCGQLGSGMETGEVSLAPTKVDAPPVLDSQNKHVRRRGTGEVLREYGRGAAHPGADVIVTGDEVFARAKFTSVDCGCNHTGAVTDQGDVFMWGSNGCGQLGVGDRRDKQYPTLVSDFKGTAVLSVSCGDEHSVFMI